MTGCNVLPRLLYCLSLIVGSLLPYPTCLMQCSVWLQFYVVCCSTAASSPHLLSANGCVAIIDSISSQLAPFTAIFPQTMFFSSHLPKAILCVFTVLCCVLQHCPPLPNMSSWLSWPHSLHFISIGSFYSHFPPVYAVALVFCVPWSLPTNERWHMIVI